MAKPTVVVESFMSGAEPSFAGANVLITGGLGFIGSTLARRLVADGATVTVVDNLWPDYGGNLFNVRDVQDRIRINISDVRDEYSMRHLIQGQDFLFNLAGQTSHLDSMTDPFTDLDINCRSQLSILESCRKFNDQLTVVFASTRQIYGRAARLPVSEDQLLSPVDVNGINKMAGERYHILYNTVYGLRTCALRLTNTYGPRMRIKDARQTFLGVWIKQLLSGEPIEVWGGSQMRDFNYVEDAVDAFLIAAQSDQALGNVYNLGATPPISLGNLAELLVRLQGKGRVVQKEFPVDRKRIDIGDYYADHSAITRDLGWAPKTPLDEGLKATIKYYSDHGGAYA
jgi:UDP-glucose 4-epimerase